MSRKCLNPGCYQGDPGDPPEYESDNAVECAECHAEIDLDDDDGYTIDSFGEYICEDCKLDALGDEDDAEGMGDDE